MTGVKPSGERSKFLDRIYGMNRREGIYLGTGGKKRGQTDISRAISAISIRAKVVYIGSLRGKAAR